MTETTRRSCPDDGVCHHRCGSACFRVLYCGPLSGVFDGDRWPGHVVASERDLVVTTVGEVTMEEAVEGGERRGASPGTGPDRVRYVVGARVRELRRERGWSIEYLASRGHLHPTAVSRVERGEREPRLRTIAQLAAGLGVPLSELVADRPPGQVVEGS